MPAKKGEEKLGMQTSTSGGEKKPEPVKKVEKPVEKPQHIVYKSFSGPQWIDGFFLNPFLSVNVTATKRVMGKDVLAMDVLDKSPWYGRKFARANDEKYKTELQELKPLKSSYTRVELVQLARDQNVELPELSVLANMGDQELYNFIFGTEADK